RVPAAAVLGFGLFANVAEPWRAGAALVCGSVAVAAHGLKAGTRLALNTSPEPFTNWTASLSEDFLLGVLIWLAGRHPGVALGAAIVVLIAGLLLASWVYRSVKRLFMRPAGQNRRAVPAYRSSP